MFLENSSMTKDGDISYIVITCQVTAKSSDLKNKFCIVLIYFVQHFISSRSHSDSSDVVAPSPLLLLIIKEEAAPASRSWLAPTLPLRPAGSLTLPLVILVLVVARRAGGTRPTMTCTHWPKQRLQHTKNMVMPSSPLCCSLHTVKTARG
jgi:hypothetical protein